MAAKQMMRLREPIVIAAKKGGYPRAMSEGTVWPDDDPAVKAYPQLFEPYERYLEVVEKATAFPGEVRVTKPKAAAKKATAKKTAAEERKKP